MGIISKKHWVMIIIGTLSLTLFEGCSTMVGAVNVEEHGYKTTVKEDKFEVREYEEIITIQTTVKGNYKEASSQGFRRLAGYIFGNNIKKDLDKKDAEISKKKEESEKIAMTAPVYQEKQKDTWVMSFTIPKGYTLETLPTPKDKRVVFKTIPAKKVATLTYTGSLTEKAIEDHIKKLEKWIQDKGHQKLSEPRSAGYNPPWTLPFTRRNEIHIDIK